MKLFGSIQGLKKCVKYQMGGVGVPYQPGMVHVKSRGLFCLTTSHGAGIMLTPIGYHMPV